MGTHPIFESDFDCLTDFRIMAEETQPTNIVSEFATYEDFLDSQITQQDLFYLEDEELARQLVELGYRGSGEVLKREEFEAKKAALEAAKLSKRTQQNVNKSQGKTFDDKFLSALAEREEPNRLAKMTSIIFIRDTNSKGQEISGYIDYSQRLKNEDFEQYFSVISSQKQYKIQDVTHRKKAIASKDDRFII